MEVELYIKDHPIPIRKPKITEVYTAQSIDPISQMDTSFKAVFFGQPDLLQLAISGWIITPTSATAWLPKDISGAALTGAYTNLTYAEIVSSYLAGDYNLTIGGAPQSLHPSYYISPFGHKYLNPIIASWDPEYQVNRRKQAFSATLYLEK